MVRLLDQRRESRSSLLVRADDSRQSLSQISGARLGLLPRGSLAGFYLPLWNLHGLRFSSVHYSLSYGELLERLRSGDLDVIAWDASLPSPGQSARAIHEDSNIIPRGALVLSKDLVATDYRPFLRVLDNSGSQLPPSIGYVAGMLPEARGLEGLRKLVSSVEGWSLPLEGQPYSAWGLKQELTPEGVQ